MTTASYPKYLQVDLDFFEIIVSMATSASELNVCYFDSALNIVQEKGKYIKVDTRKDGDFLLLHKSPAIRLDRIITINGKVGPAYDEYDAFANACLSCHAGYEAPKNI